MIEMLGVLAVMGVLTVAAFEMIGLALRSQKRTRVMDEVAVIAADVRGLFGQYDDFSAVDNNTTFAAIGISNKNPYGGRYELAAASADKRQFTVSITGLGASDCEYFKTKAWSDSAGFRASNGRQSGAASIPSDCGADNGKNTVRITYGE
jgi:type II secretory pathway pseudopilin PulG